MSYLFIRMNIISSHSQKHLALNVLKQNLQFIPYLLETNEFFFF